MPIPAGDGRQPPRRDVVRRYRGLRHLVTPECLTERQRIAGNHSEDDCGRRWIVALQALVCGCTPARKLGHLLRWDGFTRTRDLARGECLYEMEPGEGKCTANLSPSTENA